MRLNNKIIVCFLLNNLLNLRYRYSCTANDDMMVVNQIKDGPLPTCFGFESSFCFEINLILLPFCTFAEGCLLCEALFGYRRRNQFKNNCELFFHKRTVCSLLSPNSFYFRQGIGQLISCAFIFLKQTCQFADFLT